MFSFVHFSDLHLSPVPSPRLHQLLNKRLLSYLSWIKKREQLHRAEVLDQALVAMRTYAPEHICVTGDLVNLALPAEIEQAAAWLRELGSEITCNIVPGNHDTLVASAKPLVEKLWAPWMTGPERSCRFPYAIRKGPIAFIGISSAISTPPCFASGKVDSGQLERLKSILATSETEGCFRVICIHHPPQSKGDSWRRRLSNADQLLSILEKYGAELILHGHLQEPKRSEIPGPVANIPVFGAGSASLHVETDGNSGHFHGFRLEPLSSSGYRIHADHFHFQSKTGIFSIESTEQLEYPHLAQ